MLNLYTLTLILEIISPARNHNIALTPLMPTKSDVIDHARFLEHRLQRSNLMEVVLQHLAGEEVVAQPVGVARHPDAFVRPLKSAVLERLLADSVLQIVQVRADKVGVHRAGVDCQAGVVTIGVELTVWE